MPGIFALVNNFQPPQEEKKEEVMEDVLDGTNTHNSEVQNNIPNNNTPSEEVKPEEKIIVLDGPLSKIYTEALNMAYAKEGIDMMLSLVQAKNEAEVQNEFDSNDGSFVYCVGKDYLDSDELIHSTGSIRAAVESKKYGKVVVAIESGNVATERIQLLDEFCRSIGVEVHYTRGGAVRSVMNKRVKT